MLPRGFFSMEIDVPSERRIWERSIGGTLVAPAGLAVFFSVT
jgi:hypothetical protein